AGVRVLGISKDPVAKHEKFRAKHELSTELLSDAEGTVCEDYGVWKEKSMYGKTFWGIERTTLLIAGDGTVARVWPKVKVAGHAEEVLAAAQAL
ncbi:MAG: redoxin domain-containing protein, partial [Rhodobacteraceae bacterium]|nr:redoxin domain-containing protein [Paracoccaceae bacterium]